MDEHLSTIYMMLFHCYCYCYWYTNNNGYIQATARNRTLLQQEEITATNWYTLFCVLVVVYMLLGADII